MGNVTRARGVLAVMAAAALGAAGCGHAHHARCPATGAALDVGAVVVAEAPATTEVAPDLAVVRLGVEVQAPDAATAQRDATERLQRILAELEAMDVPRSALTTERLHLSAVFASRGPTPEAEPQPVGYRASGILRIRLPIEPGTPATRVGEVLDRAMGAGANEIQGITFGLIDPAAHRRHALAQAAEAARANATEMAKALGGRLGRLVEVREVGTEPPLPMAAHRMMMASDAATPVEPGTLDVRAAVQVRYEIVGGD